MVECGNLHAQKDGEVEHIMSPAVHRMGVGGTKINRPIGTFQEIRIHDSLC